MKLLTTQKGMSQARQNASKRKAKGIRKWSQACSLARSRLRQLGISVPKLPKKGTRYHQEAKSIFVNLWRSLPHTRNWSSWIGWNFDKPVRSLRVVRQCSDLVEHVCETALWPQSILTASCLKLWLCRAIRTSVVSSPRFWLSRAPVRRRCCSPEVVRTFNWTLS